jgi:hypothetical protein
LKKLFGGGERGSSAAGDRDGIYLYIRSKRTGEVIRLRLHRYNDLSATDSEGGYFARKTIVGQSSFDRIEAEFTFDRHRRLTHDEITGGELVDREAYDAYLAARSQTDASG